MAVIFGKSTIGASPFLVAIDRIAGSRYMSPQTGELEAISAYLETFGPTTMKCAVYDATYYNGEDGFHLLANGGTEEKILSIGGWRWVTFNFPISPSIVSGKEYFLLMWAKETNFRCSYDYDPPPGSWHYFIRKTYAYGAWPTITFLYDAYYYGVAIYASYPEVPEVLAPTDLLCEQKTNPTDVTDPRPEFSAIYKLD